MPSIKKIRTVSADGALAIETTDEQDALLTVLNSRGEEIGRLLTTEAALLEAVLEYFHERGIRRQRQARQQLPKKERKKRGPKPALPPVNPPPPLAAEAS